MLTHHEGGAVDPSWLAWRERSGWCTGMSDLDESRDRILSLLQALEASRESLSWRQNWCALDSAVQRYFTTADSLAALPAARGACGRDPAVRRAIGVHLNALRWPAWDDDHARFQQLHASLDTLFSHDAFGSCQPAARIATNG